MEGTAAGDFGLPQQKQVIRTFVEVLHTMPRENNYHAFGLNLDLLYITYRVASRPEALPNQLHSHVLGSAVWEKADKPTAHPEFSNARQEVKAEQPLPPPPALATAASGRKRKSRWDIAAEQPMAAAQTTAEARPSTSDASADLPGK